MSFISLGDVLWAIAARVEVPERAVLAEQADPAGLQRGSYEADARYSNAASLLHHHLERASDPLSPQWLDYRCDTGRPLPRDTAREEGMAFLFEQAKWYWQWLKFRDKRHMRKMEAGCQVPNVNGGLRMINTGGRWASPPTADDYTRGCPQQPRSTARYSRLIEEIVFEFAEIVAFLDRRSIPHALAPVGHGGVYSTDLGDTPLDEPLKSIGADVPVQSPDAGVSHAVPSAESRSRNRTAPRGKVCPIEKAILRAQDLAGLDGHDANAVYAQLVKLASDCPVDLFPLCGFKNGQLLYVKEGHSTPQPYTKRAVTAFVNSPARKRDVRRG